MDGKQFVHLHTIRVHFPDFILLHIFKRISTAVKCLFLSFLPPPGDGGVLHTDVIVSLFSPALAVPILPLDRRAGILARKSIRISPLSFPCLLTSPLHPWARQPSRPSCAGIRMLFTPTDSFQAWRLYRARRGRIPANTERDLTVLERRLKTEETPGGKHVLANLRNERRGGRGDETS